MFVLREKILCTPQSPLSNDDQKNHEIEPNPRSVSTFVHFRPDPNTKAFDYFGFRIWRVLFQLPWRTSKRSFGKFTFIQVRGKFHNLLSKCKFTNIFPIFFLLCRNTADRYVYAYQAVVSGEPLWLYVGCGRRYRDVSYLSYRPQPPKEAGETLMNYFKVPTTEALVNRVWTLGLPLTIYLSLV